MALMKSTLNKSKKGRKLVQLIEDSESEDESEHELTYYVNDRVKLMKQILKIIKPKKLKSMAPNFLKNLDMGEINSLLLEELLGISNKRLKYIFAGQNVDEDTSSSTDPEEEKQQIDVISLDDITDDDFVIEVDSSSEQPRKNKKHSKIKEEPAEKKVKKEKPDKLDKKTKNKETKKEKSEEENLMSVLELLELQARARAIRSQLVLELSKKAQDGNAEHTKKKGSEVKNSAVDDDDDAVIVESPKFNEIVIMSTDSEREDDDKKENRAKSVSHVKEELVKETSDVIDLSDDSQDAKDLEKTGNLKKTSSQISVQPKSLRESTVSSNKSGRDRSQSSEKESYKTGTEENLSKTSDVNKNKSENGNKSSLDCKEKTSPVSDNKVSKSKPINSNENSPSHMQDGLVINIDEEDIDEIHND